MVRQTLLIRFMGAHACQFILPLNLFNGRRALFYFHRGQTRSPPCLIYCLLRTFEKIFRRSKVDTYNRMREILERDQAKGKIS